MIKGGGNVVNKEDIEALVGIYQELTKKYAKEELGIKDTVENIFDLQNLNQRYNTFLNFLNINGIKYTKNESGSNSLYIKLNETGEKVRFADHKNQSIVHEKTYDDLNITDNVKLNNIINKKSEQIWKEAKKK